MKLHPNEMILFYDSKVSSHKKTRSYAHSIAEHIQEYNYSDFKFSKLMWNEILGLLDMKAKDLLNKSDSYYQKHIAGKTFDDNTWLNILINNAHLIKAPIALMHGKAVLCLTPKDIYKLTSDSIVEP